MVKADPDSVSRILDKYLPELSSEKTRNHVLLRLRKVESDHGELPGEGCSAPGSYDPEPDVGGRFADYFRHFVQEWTRELETEVSGSSCLSADNTVFADFVASQVPVVGELLVRTLLRELFVRRSRGLLRGGSPEERYRSFREWTNSAEGHAELLSRHPRAFRVARDRVRTAGTRLLHILSRVEHHRERLDSLPGVTAGTAVSAVLTGQGDTHNGGRSVAEVVFSDGGRVLYKPRPLGSEVGFNALVGWFNERLGTSLPTVDVLPCQDEGFVEYVRAGEPRSGSRGYFAGIGQLLGILYLVKAVDIHFENVVTCAAGPVVVDTETLLTPTLAARDADPARSATAEADSLLRESVTGIGVLPFTIRKAKSGEAGMDVGVIGYDPGQKAPYKSLRFRNPGRDDMFVELTAAPSANPTANLSVSRTTDLPVREQRETVKRELRRVLEYAASHKEEVMGAVEEFLGGTRFRFLRHGTMFYSQLLRMVTHPDAMGDPLVRSAVLDRVFLGADDTYAIAAEEARQLAEGDVPYFCYSSDSRALLAGDGRVVLDDAFEESGMAAARVRIAGLDGKDIDRQSALVDLSFVARLPTSEDVTGFTPLRPPGSASSRVDRTRFLREAVRIGDMLVGGMIDGPDGRSPAVWLGPQVAAPEGEEWSPGVSGFDFYTGMPGIGLALAGLARETGEERFRRASLRVVEPLEGLLLAGSLTMLDGAGGMCGSGGVAYAAATARRLLGGGGPSAGEMARALVSGTEAPALDDFVTGSAGTLATCLSLHRNAAGDEDRALTAEAAAIFAGHVMDSVRGSGAVDGRATDFTGYAHGAIGIASPLLEYAAVFGDREAAEAGTRMAEAVRDAQRGHDRDWPRAWDEDRASYAWCHGAPGILLGALEVSCHVPGLFPEETLGRLVELTLARGFGADPTYCHGDLGSLEAVLLAERVSPGLCGEAADDLYPRLFTEVIERYSERSDTKYAYGNGIMLGQAGLLWSILRHLDPETHPSVVRLE